MAIKITGAVYDEAYIRDLLKRLAGLGAKSAVLTGVRFSENEIGVMGYDGAADEFQIHIGRDHPYGNDPYLP